MAAFNFPANPSVGDQVTNGGVTYTWDGYKWNTTTAPFSVGATGATVSLGLIVAYLVSSSALNLSISLFIFLPIFTLFLMLLYIRRKYTYMEHLVFVFNTQTVFFLLLLIFLKGPLLINLV